MTVGSRRAVTNSNYGRQGWGRGSAGSARRIGWMAQDPTHVRWSAVRTADLSWQSYQDFATTVVARFDRKSKLVK